MVLAYITTALTLLRGGAGYIISFFSSGMSSYVGMFMFVIVDHWNTLRSGDLVQVFIDIGVKMARADTVIAENLPVLYGASETTTYLPALFQVLVALFSVLWMMRTINYIIKMVEENVSTAFRIGVASSLWIMSVIAVTGEPPVATLELLYNMKEVIQPSKIPFLEGGNSTAVNATENITRLRE